VGSYAYERPGRNRSEVHRFRLALTDFEALRRARQFLAELEVETREFAFATAVAGARPMGAIRTSTRLGVGAVREPW
jgi:hypothetical protein